MAKSSGLNRLIVNNTTVGAGSLYIPQNKSVSMAPIGTTENDFNLNNQTFTLELWYKPNVLSRPIPTSVSNIIDYNIWRRFYKRTTGEFLYEDLGGIGNMTTATLPAAVQSNSGNLTINYRGYFLNVPPVWTRCQSYGGCPGGIRYQAISFGGRASQNGNTSWNLGQVPDIGGVAYVISGYLRSSAGAQSFENRTKNQACHIIIGDNPTRGLTYESYTWYQTYNEPVYFDCTVSTSHLSYNGLPFFGFTGTTNTDYNAMYDSAISPERRVEVPYNQGTGYIVGKSSFNTGWALLHVNTSVQFLNCNPTYLFDSTPVYSRAITTGNVLTDTSKWYHLAVVQDSSLSTNNVKIFIDGVLSAQGTFTGANSIIDSNTAARIGRVDTGTGTYFGAPLPASHGVDGYIENLKITKGIAKYSSNFTPTVFG